jgi:3-deoxy-manno-octulosonate cytidylyltransferase (CMP-KDO synthetase)
MSADFHIIIPARIGSTRLPRKLLLDIGGMSVIERTYRQAQLANPKSTTIATDSEEIAEEAQRIGANFVITSAQHPTGTDRIAEACIKTGLDTNAIVVNVQGDEPFIPPVLIKQVANSLDLSGSVMSTLCWPLDNQAAYLDSNIVKVVRDCQNNALYFSRAPIPAHTQMLDKPENVFKHIGLYAYRVKFLLEFVKLSPCTIEKIECLEQLRVLWYGYKIKVDKASVKPKQEINTQQDLDVARNMLEPLTE